MFGTCKSDSSVLIEELDYKFIGDCSDAPKLEKILTILRSGDEGAFPDLVVFTEKRLKVVFPESGLLVTSKEDQCAGTNSVDMSERTSVASEMQSWQQEIKAIDSTLTGQSHTDCPSDHLPPVREPGKMPEASSSKGDSDDVIPKEAISDLPDKELENLATVEKLKGNDAFRIGDYPEALNYYNRSLSVSPMISVYNNRAAVYLKLKRFEEAIEDSRVVLKNDDKNIKALLRLSISLESVGKDEEASENLHRLLTIEPNNRRAQEVLDELQKKMRPLNSHPLHQSKSLDNGKLIEELSSVPVGRTRVPPTEEKTAKAHDGAVADERKGRRLKIVEVDSIEDVTKGKTSNAIHADSDKNTDLGSRHVHAENRQTVNTQVTTNDLPAAVMTLKDKGNHCFKFGKYAEAVEIYSRALNEIEDQVSAYHPADVAVLYSNRAAAYSKIGKSKECVDDATYSIELYPTSKAFMRRANAYETLERYGHSYVDNQSVLTLDPSAIASQRAMSRLGDGLRQQHGSRWREKLPPAASLTPTAASLARTSLRNTSSTPASTCLEKQPDDFETLKKRGNDCVKQGDYKRAALCYTDCIKLRSNEVSAFTNRALCHIKLNQPTEAVVDCSRALEIDSHNVKALFRRAQARKILKEYKECLTDLKKLLEIEQDNAAAKALYTNAKELYHKDLMLLRSSKLSS